MLGNGSRPDAERTLGRPDACSAFSCIPLRASSDRLSMSIERKIRGMNPAARELAIQAGGAKRRRFRQVCYQAGSRGYLLSCSRTYSSPLVGLLPTPRLN
jgi:hypothetical protein